MTFVFALVVVLLIGAVAVVAAGRGGDGVAMVEEYDDRPDVTLPADGPVTAADLRALRFTTAVRGYRASEVDALIDRLVRQLETPAPASDTTVSDWEPPRTVRPQD